MLNNLNLINLSNQVLHVICSSECDKISRLPLFMLTKNLHIKSFTLIPSHIIIFLRQVENLYIKFITLLSVANFFYITYL